MDRKVEISIEGRLRASVDEASVERAKRKAQEVEEAARKAGEGLSSLPEEVARAVEEAARRLEGVAQTLPRAVEEGVRRSLTPLEAAYARALGLDHPLYRRVLRGLEGVEAQAAGARTFSDYARLESRLAVLDRYLEQALAQGADPKAAERLREEIKKLREAIEQERERRLRGAAGGAAPPGTPPGGGAPPGGEGGEGGGLPPGPWREMAQGLLRRAAQTGLSRFGPLGALLARLGPWGTALGAVGGVVFGVDLAARYLEGLNREARGEATETADLARLLEYAGNPLAFFRQPGTLYPDRALLALGYTARDAQRIALAYGLPGGVQGDVRAVLAFARTTGLGEEVAVRAARELGLLGIDRGQAGQALEVLKAAMAEGVREGVDKASTLQGLLRVSEETARQMQLRPGMLAFQASLQTTLAGTGNRLMQGERGASVQASLQQALSGRGDPGLTMLFLNLIGGPPSPQEIGLEGAAAEGYKRLLQVDPLQAGGIALGRIAAGANPKLLQRLVNSAEAALGPGLLNRFLEEAGVPDEVRLEILGRGLGAIYEEAARKAPAMRQDLLEDPQAKNRLAWESLQMDARKRAVEEANQLATLAATRGAEAALRDFTAALGGATAALKRAFGEDVVAPGGDRRGRVEGVVRLPGGGTAPPPSEEEKRQARTALPGVDLPALEAQAQAEAAVGRVLRATGVTGITMGVGQPYSEAERRRYPILPERHQGLDVAYGERGKAGDPVPSPFAATVKRVGYDPKGYGNYVVLDVGGREVLAGHLQEVRVKPGDKVRPGDLLGLEGQTGAATGPHVHWEIRQGGKAVSDQKEFFRLFYEMLRGGEKTSSTAPSRPEAVVRLEGQAGIHVRVEGLPPEAGRAMEQGIRAAIEEALKRAVPANHRGG